MSIITAPISTDYQSLIDSTASGDTIRFAKGEHTALRNVVLRPNRTYLADLDATISSKNVYAFKPGGDNITIKRLRFGGPALGCWDDVNGHSEVRGIAFDECAFIGPDQDGAPVSGEEWAFINSNRAFVDARITNCVFDQIDIWTCVFLYGWRGLTLDHNEFLNRFDPQNDREQGRCLKLMGDDGPGNAKYPEGKDNSAILKQTCFGLTVSNNLFYKIAGMASEQQRGSDNTEYRDNVYLEPLFSNFQPDNLDRYAFSLPNARGTNLKFHHNLIRLTKNGEERLRQMLEIGGQNVKVWQNAFFGVPGRGVNASIVLDSSNGTAELTDNLMVDCPGAYSDNNGRITKNERNDANTKLDWDINRPYPRASIHGATGTTVPDPSGPAPSPIPVPPAPTPEPTPVPTFTPTLTVTGETTCTLSWPLQDGTNDYTIESKTTRGSDPWTRVGVTNSNFARIAGCHPGWEISFRVVGPTTSAIVSGRMKGNPVTVAVNLPTMLLDIPVPDPVPVPVPPNPPPLKRLVRTLTLREFDDGSFDVVKV